MFRPERAPVLVTGGNGFVGSHLIELLVAERVPVRCLVRRSSSLRYLPGAGVELCYGELASGEGLAEAVAGVDTVYHVAGITKALSRETYFRGNLRGTVNLIRVCGGVRRFVHVSSLAAVGPSADGRPLDESAPEHPVTWYGESKLRAERAIRESELGSRAVIVRPPVVYGPRDTDVYEVFRSVAKGFMVTIGRGESFFSYIHVKDLAAALVRAACSQTAPGRTYFAANPEPVSWTAFAAAAAEGMGRKVKSIWIPSWAAYGAGWCAEIASWARRKPGIVSRQKVLEARCRYWVCDVRRARQELDWSASRTLREGVEDTLAWYRDAGWLTW